MTLPTSSGNAHARSVRAALLLAMGDAAIFVFFAVQGRATHDIPLGGSPLLTVITVAAPFAAPWFVVASLLGVYRPALMIHPKRTVLTTAAAWLVAGALGLVLRSAFLQRALLLPFAVVTIGVNAALLLIWHGAFSAVAARQLRANERVG